MYDWYGEAVYASLLRLVKSEQMAREMLQDVFLKVWEKRNTIDEEKSFRGWLFRIAENRVFDHFRQLSRDRKKQSEFLASAIAFYYRSNPDPHADRNAALLHEAIESLSPQRRQIFRLCKLEGKSYKDVSRMLQISESTISDHLVKAMKSVRDFFDTHRPLLHYLFLSCLSIRFDLF